MDNVLLCFIRVIVLCACAACPCAYVCSRSNDTSPASKRRKVCSSKCKNEKDKRDSKSRGPCSGLETAECFLRRERGVRTEGADAENIDYRHLGTKQAYLSSAPFSCDGRPSACDVCRGLALFNICYPFLSIPPHADILARMLAADRLTCLPSCVFFSRIVTFAAFVTQPATYLRAAGVCLKCRSY